MLSPAKGASGVAPAKYSNLAFTADRFSGKTISQTRHELVDAQVQVLRIYLEKQTTDRLVEALDKLIECTEASFRHEEALMQCLTGQTDLRHREAHDRVLAQLASLRDSAMDFDRGRLLAQLILVDRELTSHIWDGLEAPDSQAQQDLTDSEPSLHC